LGTAPLHRLKVCINLVPCRFTSFLICPLKIINCQSTLSRFFPIKFNTVDSSDQTQFKDLSYTLIISTGQLKHGLIDHRAPATLFCAKRTLSTRHHRKSPLLPLLSSSLRTISHTLPFHFHSPPGPYSVIPRPLASRENTKRRRGAQP
jgi:hypothetical protein